MYYLILSLIYIIYVYYFYTLSCIQSRLIINNIEDNMKIVEEMVIIKNIII